MKSFLCIPALCLFASCSTSHSVTLHSDRTATVESFDYLEQSSRMENSDMISDFTFAKGSYQFRINEIDSFGHYMGDLITPEHYQWKLHADSLVVKSTDNTLYHKQLEERTCCGYHLIFTSDRQILDVVNYKGGNLKFSKRKNQVDMGWGLDNDEPTLIYFVVRFEP